MIFQKIFSVERRFKSDPVTDPKKLEALERIKDMLSLIDHRAECVPTSDPDRLIAMLSDLKGSRLNKYEKIILNEIIRA